VATEPDEKDLAAWIGREGVEDGGGPNADSQLADVATFGADRDEATRLAQKIAGELGLKDDLRIVWQEAKDERAGGSVSGGWEPYAHELLIVVPWWEKNAERGWKRIDMIAHEVRHAAQTTGGDWEASWKEMAQLGTAMGVKHKTQREAWLAIWRYRTHPLEAEAIAFGRNYRDQQRKSKA
jgi:hypothetical protein